METRWWQEMSGYLKDLVSISSPAGSGSEVSCPPILALISSDLQHPSHLPFPGTYIPRKEVEVVEIIQATIIKQNQALRLRARKECWDREGKERVTGGVLKGC